MPDTYIPNTYRLAHEMGFNPHDSLAWTLTQMGYSTERTGRAGYAKHIIKDGWLVCTVDANEAWFMIGNGLL